MTLQAMNEKDAKSTLSELYESNPADHQIMLSNLIQGYQRTVCSDASGHVISDLLITYSRTVSFPVCGSYKTVIPVLRTDGQRLNDKDDV
jgi:hypothetical protein